MTSNGGPDARVDDEAVPRNAVLAAGQPLAEHHRCYLDRDAMRATAAMAAAVAPTVAAA